MLGRFRYVGKPDRRHTAGTQVACVVHMFVMHVAEELQTWPEQEQRQRHWVSQPRPHFAHSATSCCVGCDAVSFKHSAWLPLQTGRLLLPEECFSKH